MNLLVKICPPIKSLAIDIQGICFLLRVLATVTSRLVQYQIRQSIRSNDPLPPSQALSYGIVQITGPSTTHLLLGGRAVVELQKTPLASTGPSLATMLFVTAHGVESPVEGGTGAVILFTWVDSQWACSTPGHCHTGLSLVIGVIGAAPSLASILRSCLTGRAAL